MPKRFRNPRTQANYERALKRRRASIARNALARNRRLNIRSGGFMGMELKFFDSNGSHSFTSPTDATGGMMDPATANCLNAIAIGSGPSDRDGRQVVIKSIHIKGTIRWPSTSGAQTATAPVFPACMLALVWDKQTNAAQATSETIFTNKSGNANCATAVFRNLEYTQRYQILKKKTWNMQPVTPYWNGLTTGTDIRVPSKEISFTWNVKCAIPVNFNTTNGGTVADIVDNSLHLVGFSSGVGLLITPQIQYNCRCRFTG